MTRASTSAAERETLAFAREHQEEDTARLLLSAARYPKIDMPQAVNQIEGMRTAAEKWPSLLRLDDFVYPPRLNREQASSEVTARYKAELANLRMGPIQRAADLTGGMGIDTLALSQVAQEVHYVEQDSDLCAFMERNCRALNVNNVRCHQADSLRWLAGQERYDLLYIDPARRGTAGRKVAAFEDCTPNILEHAELLRSCGKQLMVKASPMIDIDQACRQLGNVSEVHIVGVKGECKELLFLCGESTGELQITCVNLNNPITPNTPIIQDSFSFRPSDELAAPPAPCSNPQHYLYDPHAALRKGGCYRLLAQRYRLAQLAPATHLFTSSALLPDFPGRVFRVIQELPLNRKAVRAVLPDGKAHVVVRHFPVEAAALQRQLGLAEGGHLFVVATTAGTRHLGLLCERID